MFQLKIITLDEEGNPINTTFSGAFTERKDAEEYLNKHIESYKPAAGYNAEHGYWFAREGSTVTRYVIVASP